jgi:hypothetical protein
MSDSSRQPRGFINAAQTLATLEFRCAKESSAVPYCSGAVKAKDNRRSFDFAALRSG